jgi:predicted DNA-binding transcriptional regulator YafY
MDDDRDTVRRVALLLRALLTERELTYEQAAVHMKVGVHRVREIVAGLEPHFPWLKIDKSRRRHVLRLHGVGTTEATLEVGVAACFGASVAALFAGTRYHDGMRNALRFLVSTSPSPERFVDLDRRFVYRARGREAAFPERAAMLERVARAVLEQQTLRFEYQGFDADDTRADERVEPLAVVIYDHQLYVVGRRPGEGPDIWRFARMHDVRTLRAKRFEYPTEREFDPRRLFEASFGIWLQPDAPVEDVEIILARRWRAYARGHEWHPSQRRKELDDGRVSIRLKVKICPELKEWILGFGRDAEVVRPPRLHAEIGQALTDAARNYGECPHDSAREAPSVEASAPAVRARSR